MRSRSIRTRPRAASISPWRRKRRAVPVLVPSPLTIKEIAMAQFFRFLVLAALASLAGLAAQAQEFEGGDITIDKVWSRATPKGAAVGVGYLVIHNHSATPDRLTGGAADFAANVSVHEMSKDN